MKKWIGFVLLGLVFYQYAPAQTTAKNRVDSLKSAMESVLSTKGKRPVPNFMVYAENHASGFRFHEGVGVVGRNDDPIKRDYQFRVAFSIRQKLKMDAFEH